MDSRVRCVLFAAVLLLSIMLAWRVREPLRTFYGPQVSDAEGGGAWNSTNTTETGMTDVSPAAGPQPIVMPNRSCDPAGGCCAMYDWNHIGLFQVLSGKLAEGSSSTGSALIEVPRTTVAYGRQPVGFNAEVRRRPVRSLAIVATSKESHSGNPWHRYVHIYGAWLIKQVMNQRWGIDSDVNVTIFADCKHPAIIERQKKGKAFSAGWAMQGAMVCKPKNMESCADVGQEFDAVVKPLGTHIAMWSLSWGVLDACKFAERPSGMYSAWARSQQGPLDEKGRPVLAPPKPSSSGPIGCILLRSTDPKSYRRVQNFAAALEVMRRVFPVVREIFADMTWDEKELLENFYDCSVVFGVHGAAWVNIIYTQPSCGAVEIGPAKPWRQGTGLITISPQYYKNMAELSGRPYYMVRDFSVEVSSRNWVLSKDVLASSEAALREALAEHLRRLGNGSS